MPLPNDHLHTYQKIRSRPKFFRCTHPECNHIKERELLVGKKAQCPYCEKAFILEDRQLRNKNPRCNDCKRTPVKILNQKKVDIDIISALLERPLEQNK